MSLKFQHSYNLIGTPTVPATLTALVTGNTRSVIIKDLANQVLGIAYTPHSGQTNRFAIVTIEVNNTNDMSTIPTTGWKPFCAAVVSASPNEVDVLPVLETAYGTNANVYGTPIVLPTNSTSPTSTASTTYLATYNLNLVARWVRVSMAENGSTSFGTGSVEISIQE